MLYQRWRTIAEAMPGRTALRDIVARREWTFGELFIAGEARDAGQGRMVHPTGHSADFILDVIAAWREGKFVCPLEEGRTPPVIPSAPAYCSHFKCTSATGGAGKLVAFTSAQLAADAQNIVSTMGLRPDWPNVGVISMAHSYGFSNLVLPLLLHGIPLILAPAPLPEIMRTLAEKEKAVTLAAVPAMWRAWNEARAISPGIRLAISAGAPLPLALEKSVFTNWGVKIHNFLGSTECGGIAYDAAEIPREDPDCVGGPMKNVTVQLNEEGCLSVRSGAVGETYLPEKSSALAGGVFQTSDLAEIREGRVFLRGRLGDQINMAGRKVLPETIEQALLAHPQVKECLVFGIHDAGDARGDVIAAVVATTLSEAELKAFMLEKLPAWQTPREWWIVDLLPVNERGKLSRSEWRERLVKNKPK
jgi:acyl-coenzyme A synthetase/AMP-(fatty) acid ligase